MNKEQAAIVLVMGILIAVAATIAFIQQIAKATVDLIPQEAKASSLSLEAPPLPNLALNGTELNLTADDQDRDISIDPVENITFANGTVTMSTAGATDLDINEFPPIGITVLIQNETITITKNQVSIIDPPTLAEEIAIQALESNDDGPSNNGGDGGSDEDEDE